MAVVQEGIKVCIIFEAKLETGEIVLKTEEDKPLEVTIGEGTTPKSIEDTIVNMKERETKEIKLEPQEAFGTRLDELVIDLPKKWFGPDADLEIGLKVSMNSPKGKKIISTYTGSWWWEYYCWFQSSIGREELNFYSYNCFY